MTQKELADHLGCDIKVINRIVNGRTSVSAAMAVKLGAAFRTTPEFWLNAQNAVDLYRAEKKLGKLPSHCSRRADGSHRRFRVVHHLTVMKVVGGCWGAMYLTVAFWPGCPVTCRAALRIRLSKASRHAGSWTADRDQCSPRRGRGRSSRAHPDAQEVMTSTAAGDLEAAVGGRR